MASRDWLRVDGFDEILDSLTFSQPEDEGEFTPVRICEERHLREGIEFPPVDLWLPTDHMPRLDGLKNLIRKGLIEIAHPVTVGIVDSLLTLIAVTPGKGCCGWRKCFRVSD